MGNDFFQGEHLWYGQVGHLLLVLSLVCTFFCSLAYLQSFLSKDENQAGNWTKIARSLFYVHAFSIISVFVLLFFMMLGHHFEYHYVWRHSSMDLPKYYIVSAFWEGQEGSFLLWMFWHSILGMVLMRRAKEWESTTMIMVALVQFALSTMVIGIIVFGYKIGSNPFTLLRNELQIPILSRPNYLEFIKDGNGLNVLLQNYWICFYFDTFFLCYSRIDQERFQRLGQRSHALGSLLWRSIGIGHHDGWRMGL
jgi:cytochrome c-type biogenesis protein CcmF